MDKLEKVVKGMECHMAMLACDKCPYYCDDTCPGIDGIVYDALALLKAQEPRVMTLKEVLALPCDTPIFIENCDSLNGWDVFAGITKDDEKDVVTGAQWSTCEYWQQDEYGDTWRCWTSRPTDAQREEAKWE